MNTQIVITYLTAKGVQATCWHISGDAAEIASAQEFINRYYPNNNGRVYCFPKEETVDSILSYALDLFKEEIRVWKGMGLL